MAEEARLESVYTSKAYPGFESPSLRLGFGESQSLNEEKGFGECQSPSLRLKGFGESQSQ